MSSKETSGWQQAMLAVPDLAPLEGNTSSTNEDKITKKRKSVSVKTVEDVKRPKLDSQESPEKKRDMKTEETKKTPSPTRSMRMVKRSIRKDDEKATDEADKHGDDQKGTQDAVLVPFRRTRSTSRQLGAGHTQTLKNDKEDKEKVIRTPDKETMSVERRVMPKNKETLGDDKGERLGPATRTTKSECKLSLDDKEDFDEAHKSNLASDERPAMTERSSTLGQKEALDLEKLQQKPKETRLKVKQLNETRPEARRPREKAPTHRTTPAKAPERFYSHNGADPSSYAYGNMIRSMTTHLRREWGGVGSRYGRGRRRR